MKVKEGRGRNYRITPAKGFSNRALAMSASWLEELRERVYDQIEDLVPEALNYAAPGTSLSIGKLVIHMAWAETVMVGHITKGEVPTDLATLLLPGALSTIGDVPGESRPAKELIALCDRVRNEVTIPGLRDRNDPDEVCRGDGSTPRGILNQLMWHWVYHSGQIGLIRFEWGSDYTWSFDGPLAPDPC